MKAIDFDFHLPESSIALTPVLPRDMCRLLVLRREDAGIEHRSFRDLPEYLHEGDLLLLNNTRVFPARLTGTKATGGKIEFLLVKEVERNVWEILSRGRYTGKVRISDELSGEMSGGKVLRFDVEGDVSDDLIWKAGMMPLPPYIKRMPSDADKEWYQTVYAERAGSIAAPTAGLHFTPELIEELRRKGVLIRFLTLHVGTGTFKPMKVEDIGEHVMDEEYFELEEGLIETVKRARGSGGKVIAVGTTTTRAIESYFSERYNPIETVSRRRGENSPMPGVFGSPRQTPICGSTDMFIYPGYSFGAVDALITNFHLPRSTPLMLTSAFCGLEFLKDAYRQALSSGYRFFSYGDAMLIL